MKKRQFFYKFMIFLATLSLILVALAPVVYVLAPTVAVPADQAAVTSSADDVPPQPEFVELESTEE